jgi:hypothetical protein
MSEAATGAPVEGDLEKAHVAHLGRSDVPGARAALR